MCAVRVRACVCVAYCDSKMHTHKTNTNAQLHKRWLNVRACACVCILCAFFCAFLRIFGAFFAHFLAHFLRIFCACTLSIPQRGRKGRGGGAQVPAAFDHAGQINYRALTILGRAARSATTAQSPEFGQRGRVFGHSVTEFFDQRSRPMEFLPAVVKAAFFSRCGQSRFFYQMWSKPIF